MPTDSRGYHIHDWEVGAPFGVPTIVMGVSRCKECGKLAREKDFYPKRDGGETMKATVNGITFDDADIVNPDDFVPKGESNPHNVRPWLLDDHGFTLCVVFESSLSDALDEAADAGKLECYAISEEDMKDYKDEEGITFLGNYCKPYDIEGLGFTELDNPPYSFAAMFNAAEEE